MQVGDEYLVRMPGWNLLGPRRPRRLATLQGHLEAG